jgi:hypothetical protein
MHPITLLSVAVGSSHHPWPTATGSGRCCTGQHVALDPHFEGACSMTKEVFEAFEGQQETFGYSQAV